MPKFTRFTETIDKKSSGRVVSITVKPLVTDCTRSEERRVGKECT